MAFVGAVSRTHMVPHPQLPLLRRRVIHKRCRLFRPLLRENCVIAYRAVGPDGIDVEAAVCICGW
jgi:hypothetical protein